jgi:hypothetical protein
MSGILNYTTTVSAEKTATEITQILVRGKAQAILTEYNDKHELTAISFRVAVPLGVMPIKLPLNIDAILQIMTAQARSGKIPRKFANDRGQATRVGLRILKDWVEAQMALIQIGMATIDQVFLPYAQTPTGETVYERFKAAPGSILQLNT